MRLEQKQIKTLIDATRQCFGENACIWLFGSRTDDNQRGGDIDLYIETDLQEELVAAKLQMRSLIWPTFGEQKIDILIRSRHREMTPMQSIAKENGIPLKSG